MHTPAEEEAATTEAIGLSAFDRSCRLTPIAFDSSSSADRIAAAPPLDHPPSV
jgi:hypothetical protein